MLGVLAQAYTRTGEGDLARQVYEKLAGIEPDNPTWKERLGEARAPGKRPAAAPAAAPARGPLPDLAEMSGDYSMEELEEVSGELAAAY